jgi:hypothetical protein
MFREKLHSHHQVPVIQYIASYYCNVWLAWGRKLFFLVNIHQIDKKYNIKIAALMRSPGAGVAQCSVWLRTRWPGFDPRQGPLCPDRLWGPPSLLSSGYQRALSPGVKRGRGVTLTTHLHLVPRSRMIRSYTSSLPQTPSRRVSGQLYVCFIKSPFYVLHEFCVISRSRKILRDLVWASWKTDNGWK